MTIKVLPDEVIGRIAAGEAIERPASVAKELIENAIDAGASSVHIEVEAGGKRLLRVSDNGAGIRQGEIELAFKRHATSKLRSAAELQGLATLGFRGEALSSIAAVSRATIVTRHRAERMGASLSLNGGFITRQRHIGAPAGASVTVENLFFNTPVRLKFLKSDATEKRHIHWVTARYAMAYPHIAFALIQDGRERFRSSGAGALADVIAKAFGLNEFKQMVAVESVERRGKGRSQIGVAGYVSLPSLYRGSRDRIMLFVNGRAVQDSALSHAVTGAYDGLLKAGAFPFAVLLLETPADFVDVNVHPTKAEVRFRDAHLAFLAVQRAAREALLGAEDSAPAADMWSASGFSDDRVDYPGARPYWRGRNRDELFDDDDLDGRSPIVDAPDRARTLPLLRVVGQVGAAYIIAEGPAGLYLVDQNAAHERVLYQQLADEAANGGIESAELPESQAVLLSPADSALLAETAELFARLNFEIEVFGPNSYILRRSPTVLAGQPTAEFLPRILAQLRRCDKTEAVATAALAAAAAVRGGQILGQDEMQAMIARLERCPEPFTSPSGRRTIVHFSREHLADEFERR